MANKPSNCVYSSIAPQASDPAGDVCAGSNNSTPISSYQCGTVNQFMYKKIYVPTISARETDVGVYAEDDWKAGPNLTLSYGIRMEAQNVINSSHDFSPRLSLAYGVPRKNGITTTVLRGAFGVFYNRFSLGSIYSQIANTPSNSQSFIYSNPSAACMPTPSGSQPYSSACTLGTGQASGATTPTVNDPNLRSAYTVQTAGTLEQQVGKFTSISLTYLNARGFHQFMSRSIPTSPGSTTINNVNQSEGIFRQNQINANINVRTPKGTSIFGYYSANWVNSNISGITDPFNPSVDYGRAAFGVRSRMVLGGSIPLPFNISASPLIFASSGSPYSITSGIQDAVTRGYSDRPEFAPGYSAANANCLVSGDFSNANTLAAVAVGTIPVNQIPVNICTGPASVSLNLRLSKTIGVGPKTAAALAAAQAAAGGPGRPGSFGGIGGGPGGPGGGRGGGGGMGGGRGGGGGMGGGMGGASSDRKYNLTLGAQASNLFNEVPYSSPISTLSNPLFGQTLSVTGGNSVRTIMLQANFSF